MYPIQEISNETMGLPFSASKLMPPMEDMPEEFKHFMSPNATKWNKLFSDWFFCGLSKLELKPKEGVDQMKALRHIKTVMGSFEPQHEHKEAAVAYLLSEWFEDATWEKAKEKTKKV